MKVQKTDEESKPKETSKIQPQPKNKKRQAKEEEMWRFPLKLINQVLIMASMQEC